ncbi:hypothetical protein [Hydrogenophaga sp.]|jgi:hypothetical protein|uniref:hypothetical protein n=1 Tax=Hydrogenophaga sp. TaxID=1904254 RepID=UPI003F70FBC6
MHPIALLTCLGIVWAILQLWLVPLVKDRWKAGDLKLKAARAGVLVVVEKLRDFSAVGIFAIAATTLLVLGANLLSSLGVKAAIAASGEVYQFAKAFSGNYGRALGVLGLVAAAIVLWFAARRAHERVSEVWIQKAKAVSKALRTDPSILEAARQDRDLRTILAQLDAAMQTIQTQDSAAERDTMRLQRAHGALNRATHQLAMEMARKQIDFPDAAGTPTAAEASQPKSTMDRVLRVLSSKKLSEDLGLVRKPVGRIATALLFVSLTGWAAVPLANSLLPTVNNLRVALLEAQAQQRLDIALSRVDEPVNEYEAPDEDDVEAATRLLARAFLREIAHTPLLPGAASAGERRAAQAEAEVLRAQMAEQRFRTEQNAAPATQARADAVNSGSTPDKPSAAVLHAEEVLEPVLRETQQRQPNRFAILLQQWKARYSTPVSPLDAQGRIVTHLLDKAAGAVDLELEAEAAEQVEKLSKDLVKEAARTWLNAVLKSLLTQALTGVARPEVKRAFAFEMSSDSRAVLEELQAAERRGLTPGRAASGEAQKEAKVVEQTAPLDHEALMQILRPHRGGPDAGASQRPQTQPTDYRPPPRSPSVRPPRARGR